MANTGILICLELDMQMVEGGMHGEMMRTPFSTLPEHIKQGSHISVMKKKAKKHMTTTST